MECGIKGKKGGGLGLAEGLFGENLLENVQVFAAQGNIKCVRVEVIGTVERAVIGCYGQDKRG